MAVKGQKPFDDTSLLSQEDQDAILAKARETVTKERTEAAEKSFLAKALDAERKKHDVSARDEELVPVLIDLPGFANDIRINNQQYFHGSTYTVPVSLARDLQSQMARSWEHENEVGGANRDAYQKPRNQSLRPGMH